MNINDEVIVILTDYGKEILDNYKKNIEKQVNFKYTSSFLNYDENGKYKTQMWNLMFIFGKHIYSGKQIFLHNQIYKD